MSPPSLLRNGFVYAVAKFLPRGMGFLLLPFYTAYLNPAEYGRVSLAESIAVIVAIFASAGLPSSLTRMYYADGVSGEQRRRRIGVLFLLLLASSLTVGTAALVLGPQILAAFPGLSLSFYPLVAIAVFTAIANQVNHAVRVFFQAEERSLVFAVLEFGLFVFSALLSVALICVVDDGAWAMLTGRALGAAVFVLGGIPLLVRQISVALRDRREIAAEASLLARYASPLVPQAVIAFILTASDRFFLEYYFDSHAVGLYSLAYTVGITMHVVTAAALLTWSPRFYRLANDPTTSAGSLAQYQTLLLGILVAVGMAGTVASEEAVVWLLDPSFHSSSKISGVIIGGYVFHAFFSVFTLGVLHVGKTSALVRMNLFAMLLNLVLNAVLVPEYGAMGAAWATLMAFAASAVMAFAISARVFPIPYHAGTLLLLLSCYGVVLGAHMISDSGTLERCMAYGAAVLLSIGIAAWYRANPVGNAIR